MSRPMSEREKRFNKIVAQGKEEFANHVATITGDTPGEGLTCIIWSKQDSSCFWMDIIIHAGAVFIRGDLGEATYVYSHRGITPGFLLSCSFDYFHGKCEASEKGTRPKDWSKEVALEWLADKRKNLPEEDPDSDLAKFDELVSELRGVAHNQQEWVNFVRDHYDDEIQDVFGQDAWECGVWDAGEVPMSRCILHWLGIRMALQQFGYGKKEARA